MLVAQLESKLYSDGSYHRDRDVYHPDEVKFVVNTKILASTSIDNRPFYNAIFLSF